MSSVFITCAVTGSGETVAKSDRVPFTPEAIADDLAVYRQAEAPGPRLAAFLATVPRDPMDVIDFLVMLNSKIANEIGYVIRMEAGVQTAEETLERGTASCRDSAGRPRISSASRQTKATCAATLATG